MLGPCPGSSLSFWQCLHQLLEFPCKLRAWGREALVPCSREAITSGEDTCNAERLSVHASRCTVHVLTPSHLCNMLISSLSTSPWSPGCRLYSGFKLITEPRQRKDPNVRSLPMFFHQTKNPSFQVISSQHHHLPLPPVLSPVPSQ